MIGRSKERRGRGERSTDARSDDDRSSAERLLVAISVLFTLVLFSYVVWQGVTTPLEAEPTATVTGVETIESGDVKVTVLFTNAQDVGVVAATVTVDCDTPPPELAFEHVPADDRRVGYVTCPAGTENPSATVSTWTEA